MKSQRELRAWFRSPDMKYLVAIDSTKFRHTTNDLAQYREYISELCNWSTMDVYYRYGVNENGKIVHLNQAIEQYTENELIYFDKSIDIRYHQIARYNPNFIPLQPDPRILDVTTYPRKKDEAVKAWRIIVKGHFIRWDKKLKRYIN